MDWEQKRGIYLEVSFEPKPEKVIELIEVQKGWTGS